jgi:uncharacterized protein
MTADALVAALKLEPHPEGGAFIETFRDSRTIDGRAASTAIYFLLRAGQRSHWHRIDAVEIWHFYAGAPLELGLSEDGVARAQVVLGTDFAAGQKPQVVVPAHCWQAARSLGEWTLVGCTVAPGFDFNRFELAETGWAPG